MVETCTPICHSRRPRAKVPGVIVLMEDFGGNKHIQEVTDKLSREGYVAVAPVL
jgi:dienelactone hydrolase